MTHDAEREALLESAYDAAWEAVGRNATTTDAVMLRVRQKLSVEEIRRFMGTVVPAVLQARAASVPAHEQVPYAVWRQGFDAVAKWKASRPATETWSKAEFDAAVDKASQPAQEQRTQAAGNLSGGLILDTPKADNPTGTSEGSGSPVPALNHAPGYCPHCKQYTIAEPLPAQEPVSRMHPTGIYAFAGWLTMRPGMMKVGGAFDAAPMADAVGEYLDKFPERFAAPPADTARADRIMELADRFGDERFDCGMCLGEEQDKAYDRMIERRKALEAEVRKEIK